MHVLGRKAEIKQIHTFIRRQNDIYKKKILSKRVWRLLCTWVSCLFLLVLVNDLIFIGQFHILVLHMAAITTEKVSFTKGVQKCLVT